MSSVMWRLVSLRDTGGLAYLALRSWTLRHVLIAGAAGLGVALVIGVATVLIPNPLFTREIPPVWWNYPVWLAIAAMTGMLVVTYVRVGGAGHREEHQRGRVEAQVAGAGGVDGAPPASGQGEQSRQDVPGERGTSRFGLAGGVLAWFAVGCPVCNKLALLALGYTGAITWFAPIQPYLALAALVLTGVALVSRLRGQVACPAPRPATEVGAA